MYEICFKHVEDDDSYDFTRIKTVKGLKHGIALDKLYNLIGLLLKQDL